ncbi:MAG: hypothetical protein ACTS6G_03245 [Candidatus Hodgkinia cicadicola]
MNFETKKGEKLKRGCELRINWSETYVYGTAEDSANFAGTCWAQHTSVVKLYAAEGWRV